MTVKSQSGDLSADEAIYDRVSVGDQVNVRYLHLGGWFAFARLSDRSTLSILLDGRSWLFALPLVAGIALLIWVMTSVSKQKKLSVILAMAALTLFVFVVDYVAQWRAVWPLATLILLLLFLGGLLFGGRFIRRLSPSEHLDGHRLLKLALAHTRQHNAQSVQDVEGQHGQQHGDGID